ncbi:MAG: hypothetical protein UR60_C0038G0003 [Candidatus Moranbacteria bacterium GW2011_GWF2_34_56]|nr:MAG: hypothetical protein UR60_C0038G0003 [Candidatus Moranbacteria bacterium GW2011_GWF2_34_56]
MSNSKDYYKINPYTKKDCYRDRWVNECNFNRFLCDIQEEC